MDCLEFNRMLDNYENLNDNELSALNNHAAQCEACKGELEFYKSIVMTAASLPAPEPPSDLTEKINSRIDNLPKRTITLDRFTNSWKNHSQRYMTAAACLAVGIVVGLNGKNISDRLSGGEDDGVISTSVSVADSTAGEIDDYKLVEDEPTAAPTATEETVIAAKTDASAKPAVTVKPNDTAKAASAPAKPTAVPAVKANTQKPTVAPSAPPAAAEPVKETDAPAPAVTEETKKTRYTIARGNYHVPDTTATAAPTKEPETTAAAETPVERYQIAMGSYEISEDEKKVLAQNKLIVNEADISKIIECMNSSWIKGTTGGYTASASAFANFLSKLDAEGVYYTYVQCSETSGEVNFVLLAN